MPWHSRDGATRDVIARRVEGEVDRAGLAALARLGRRLSTSGEEWDYYEADPLARSIHLALADILLVRGMTVADGGEVGEDGHAGVFHFQRRR